MERFAKISGFTFLRNVHKLYYPVQESILSILDLVDEFVIVFGKGDADDNSLELIQKINSPKIKVIHSTWDLEQFKGGTIYAQQTDLAKNACSGDWLFYLQGDEVIHEKYLNNIKKSCNRYLNHNEIEGFVFGYKHFWGDYDHYFADHCWYKNEIRIVRNLTNIHSWRDAQSFRYIPDFDGLNYNQIQNTRRLNCVKIEAEVFHYGWVRPPQIMMDKNKAVNRNYAHNHMQSDVDYFDYGRMDYCKKFTETHPQIMKSKIAEHNWGHLLRYSGPQVINRTKLKHEKTKYRIINWLETNLLGGKVIGGFKNYNLVRRG